MKSFLIFILFLVFFLNVKIAVSLDVSTTTTIPTIRLPPCTIDSDCSSILHDDCNLVICNQDSYTCQIIPTLAGTTCDDGLLCTFNDVCTSSGTCQGTPVTCNDGNTCTDDYCSEVTGRCVYDPSQRVGSSCSTNATLCYENNKCSPQGMCVKGSPVHCPTPNSCNKGVCDPKTGMCSIKPTQGMCANDACSKYSRCKEGTCASSVPTSSTISCFSTSCNPATGETTTTLDTGYCYINNLCVVEGALSPHHEDLVCDPSRSTVEYTPSSFISMNRHVLLSKNTINTTGDCTGMPEGTPCSNDRDRCWDWTCDQNAQCVRSAPSSHLSTIYNMVPSSSEPNALRCLSRDGCHSDSVCQPTTGYCNPTLFADGTPCDSQQPPSSTCIKGTCTPTSLRISNQPSHECQGMPDYTLCCDGDPLTPFSVCINEACVGEGEFICPNDNPCLSVHYDAAHGCVTSFNDGAPCGADNLCLANARCVSGQCAVKTGTPTVCPSYPCSATTCFPYSGCASEGDLPCSACAVASDCPAIPCKHAVCDGLYGVCAYVDDDSQVNGCIDSTFCGGAQFCSAGTCHKGTPPSCDDGNDCTVDTCSPDTDSCVHTVRTGEACVMADDACVDTATCSAAGICVSDSSILCDDPPKCKISLGCDKDSRMCSYTNMPDYYPCISDDPCVQESHCMSGRCVDQTARVCAPPDACHDVGFCAWDTGDCLYLAKQDGFPCGNDKVCVEGACSEVSLPPPPTSMTYDPQCQTIKYSPTLHAYYVEDLPDDLFCDTGSPEGECSKQDTCRAGRCVDNYATGTLCRDSAFECDSPEYCLFGHDFCPQDTYMPNDTPCQTDFFCDISKCMDGTCTFSHMRSCEDAPSSMNPCHIHTCDRFLDVCTFTHVEDHTPCGGDTSSSSCIDRQECLTGRCTTIYSPFGYECARGKHCNGISDSCINNPMYDCNNYATPCSDSIYDHDLGRCVSVHKADGIPCPDLASICGSAPICSNGQCVASIPMDCSHLDDVCGVGVADARACFCEYQITNPDCHASTCEGGCTHAYTYWQSYNDYAVIMSHRIPWPDNFATQMLCEKTTYQWLIESSKGNAWRKLAQAYITAFLNIFGNAACYTFDVANAMNDAASLLTRDCDVLLSVSDPSASDYRRLVSIIDGYNTGITGPGNCIDDSISDMTMSKRISHALSFPIKFIGSFSSSSSSSSLKSTGFRKYASGNDESTCTNGDWDYALSECICHYGWAGSDCNTCATPNDPTKVFLCVPTRLPDNPYLLRQIPANKVQYYMGLDHSTLPFVSIPNSPAFYPGTEGRDCFCQQDITTPQNTTALLRVSQRNAISRNVAVSVTDHQDLFLYIDIIESDLGVCELTWEGNTSLPEPTIVEIIIENTDVSSWKVACVTLSIVLGVVILLTIATMITRYVSSERKRRRYTRVESNLRKSRR